MRDAIPSRTLGSIRAKYPVMAHMVKGDTMTWSNHHKTFFSVHCVSARVFAVFRNEIKLGYHTMDAPDETL